MKSSARAPVGSALAKWSLVALVNVALIEILSFAACQVLIAKGLVFYAPSYSPAEFGDYMWRRDAVLGWTSKTSDASDVDDSGSRRTPAFPEPTAQPNCISAYGDSFVWGDEVDDAHAWPNVLSGKLKCRVANFGVRGYGTDQSLLRFAGNRQDGASVVLMGYMPENIMRNVNQYRELLYSRQEFGLKPRYDLDGAGGLKFIPLPTLSEPEFARLVNDPNSQLKDEYFKLDGATGIIRATFPYSFSLARALKNDYIAARLTGEQRYFEYYEAGHPSRALPLTEKILGKFHETASARGKESVVALIPNCRDLQYYQATGRWSYGNLTMALQKDGIPYFDAGPYLARASASKGGCNLCRACGGHFNEEGNRLLATALADYLAARNLPLQRTIH